MKNFKGTPGPWEVDEVLRNTLDVATITANVNKKVCDLAAYEFRNCSIEETNANALLISKAPEMLEMLETLENDNGAIPELIWNKIQNLIKEATKL